MLKVVCPVDVLIKAVPCKVSVQLPHGSVEKICPSQAEAALYVKELMDSFEVKGYQIVPKDS